MSRLESGIGHEGVYTLSGMLPAKEDVRLRYPMVVEPGYIVPKAETANSDAIAALLVGWITSAPAGSITKRDQEWITSQWKAGNGILIVGHPEGGKHQTLFGEERLDHDVLSTHIIAAAFINPLGNDSMQDAVELGTVISNPKFRSTDDTKGLEGGLYAFQAINHRAAVLYEDANRYTWVRGASEAAVKKALGGNLQEVNITDPVKFQEIFSACIPGAVGEGCPDYVRRSSEKNLQGEEKLEKFLGKCCHTGYDLSIRATEGMFEAED